MGKLFCDADRCLFDSVAQEVNELAGTTGYIFQLEQDESVRDPLYDEPSDMAYKRNSEGVEGIECPMLVKDPERSPTSGEEGFRLQKNTRVYVAVKDLTNRDLRRPRVGDIFKIWNQYYDVTDSSVGDAYVSDSGEIPVVYEVNVVRRTQSPPEGLWLRNQ